MSLVCSIDSLDILKNDIIKGTEWDTLIYNKLRRFGLMAECKTTLKGKVVTTAWKLEKDLSIRLITLIPGGDKKWNSK